MFVVDTNVLLYAADESATEHRTCRDLLERWRTDPTPWYLTWNVVYEFLRIATHPRVFRAPWTSQDAWAFLDAVLTAPSCSVLTAGDRHAEVLAGLLDEHGTVLRGNVLHDAHTVVLMREHGLRRVVTRDTEFHRFPVVEVIDPLTLDPRGDHPW